jgi:hypothetical protein
MAKAEKLVRVGPEQRPLACLVCGHDRFHVRRVAMSGPLAAALNFEWASPTADCYSCTRCGFVHWFVPVD